MAHLKGLNSGQLAATTCEEPVLQILAGPGCGKTKTLMSRICFLLDSGISPDNIIVTTFTVKASREMKERITLLKGEEITRSLIMGTFHSICRMFLARYYKVIGLPDDWGIADNNDSQSILSGLIEEHNDKIKATNGPREDIIDENGAKMHGTISKFKSQDKIPTFPQDRKSVVHIYRQYMAKLRRMHLLDFDDLLLRGKELLETHPNAVRHVQHTLVDEFQDTNVVQYQLLRLFASANNCVTIVGDPDQGIYAWRSADVTNLSKMHRDFDSVAVINLEDNYRSTEAIIQTAIALIQQDIERPAKDLRGTKAKGQMPVLRTLNMAEQEAHWIAREAKRIRGCTGGMIDFQDIAILVRAGPITRLIEQYLTKAGISYKMVGGRRFFDREEVKDMTAYLRVICATSDVSALMRIINVPPRHIGKEKLKFIDKKSEDTGKQVWDILNELSVGKTRFDRTDKTAIAQIRSFIDTIESIQTQYHEEGMSISDTIKLTLEAIQYEEYLKKKHRKDFQERMGNILELCRYADEVETSKEFELPGPNSENSREETVLEKFLRNISLLSDTGNEENNGPRALTISTIHAAKGLEWPVVFIPSVYEGMIPHFYAQDINEERRVLYVAMTRAAALLYISVPGTNSRGQSVEMSKFLEKPVILDRFVDHGHDFDLDELGVVLGRDVPPRAVIQQYSSVLPALKDDIEYGWQARNDIEELLLEEEMKFSQNLNSEQKNGMNSKANSKYSKVNGSRYSNGAEGKYSQQAVPASSGFVSSRVVAAQLGDYDYYSSSNYNRPSKRQKSDPVRASKPFPQSSFKSQSFLRSNSMPAKVPASSLQRKTHVPSDDKMLLETSISKPHTVSDLQVAEANSQSNSKSSFHKPEIKHSGFDSDDLDNWGPIREGIYKPVISVSGDSEYLPKSSEDVSGGVNAPQKESNSAAIDDTGQSRRRLGMGRRQKAATKVRDNGI